MPDEKPTVQIAAVPDWAVELKVLATATKDDVRELRADVGLVANDLSLVKERVTLLERDRDNERDRVARNSNRVKELADTTSNADLSLQAQQSDVIVKVRETHALAMSADQKATETQAAVAEIRAIATESLATQTELYTELLKVTKQPLVRKIAYGLAGLAVGWLTAKGLL